MQWLKQSTATTVKMGPFLDDGDGNTELTGLAIGQAGIRLSKNGGAFAQTNNAAGATHDEFGNYGIPLDTTDTNTLGRLRIYIHDPSALAVWADFMILPANVWDSLFGADKLQVHADEITTGLITAAAVSAGAADKVADHVMRRTTANVEASSDGDTLGHRSLYGAVASARHKRTRSGSTVVTMKANDSTTLVIDTITSSSSVDPITEVDPPA